MVADLARGRFGGWANPLERFAATYACRAAIKAGERLDDARDAGAAGPAASPPPCRRTTCTGAPPSCSCRGRSWSVGLAGARTPGPRRAHRGRQDRGRSRPGRALAARGHLRRLAPGLSPTRHRHRQALRRGSLARVPHHGLDLVEPGAALQRRADSPRTPRAGSRRSGPRPACPSWSAAPGSTSGPWWMDCSPSRRWTRERRDAWSAWTARAGGRRAACAGPRRLDPGFRGGGRQRAMREHRGGAAHRPSAELLAARRPGAAEPSTPWYVVLTAPRPVLHQRIEARAEEMVRAGLIEEVAAVLAEGHPPKAPGTRRHRHPGGGGVPARQADPRERSRGGRHRAPGSTPSGRRPGSGISSRGRC